MFNVKFHLHKTLRCYFSLFTLVPFPLSPLNPKFLFVIKFLTPFCVVLSTPKLLVFLSKVVVFSFSWFFGQVSYSMFLFFFFGKEVIIIIIIFLLLPFPPNNNKKQLLLLLLLLIDMPLQVDNCKFCQKASYKYTNMALKKKKTF